MIAALVRPASRATGLSAKVMLVVAAGAVLALLPVVTSLLQSPYYVVLVSRLLIFAIAATALNLCLGFGGMVSFGHSLFMGVGAYSVGILAALGTTDGWAHLVATIMASALTAAVTGAIALRTRGVAFIMITLAFGQMFFFLIYSLKQFGGDDGLTIRSGSRFGDLSLSEPTLLYYVALALLVTSLVLSHRLYGSRFGLVLRGCMVNEDRMLALGYPTIRYKLAAYVLSGIQTGIAGMLLANLTLFASPSYASWTVSGDLMIMVVLGGTGTIVGPAVGAFAFLITGDLLRRVTDHWLGGVGIVVVAIGLLARRGLWGSLERGTR